MEFSEQIKRLRREHHLTQEQLAAQLHVSRQTISSWERQRNLPDLEMVVLIAQQFGLSLDRLILGDEQMTHKLVRDGDATKRTWLNLAAALMALLGAVCFLVKAVIGVRVDSQGFLHEPFFLLPLGYLLLGISLVLALGILGRKLRQQRSK
ncbi:DUF3955 domain-containing protein [Lactobacillus selangorensis]|nr:DUF3955 domain-containing protein [Lactobacillus selangorensis]